MKRFVIFEPDVANGWIAMFKPGQSMHGALVVLGEKNKNNSSCLNPIFIWFWFTTF